MAEVKRKNTKETQGAEDEFVGNLKTNLKKRSGPQAGDYAESDYQKELMSVASGETIFVWNVSGANFHVPPKSFRPEDNNIAEIVRFDVNEVRAFDKHELDNKQFKQCLFDKKLRLVSEADADKIKRDGDRENKKANGGGKVGLAESGLPKNTKAALNYIFDCEDIDELEGYTEIEDREAITAAIEERIEELEDGEFKN